jgi:hypothetical protein
LKFKAILVFLLHNRCHMVHMVDYIIQNVFHLE